MMETGCHATALMLHVPLELQSVLCRLPDRIRPGVLAFGGLADIFLPFKADGRTHELKLASIVMKAVRAQHPSIKEYAMPCAGKIGDDANAAKVQVSRDWHHDACDPPRVLYVSRGRLAKDLCNL